MSLSFQDLVNQIIQEQGITILEQSDRCKTLLNSYAKDKFKREIRRFIQSLEIDCYREMLISNKPSLTKQQLIKRLCDEYIIPQEEAEETLHLLETLIEEQKEAHEESLALVQLEQAARNGDYRAKYDLGVLFEKIKRYESSIYWLKEAARQSMSLYESLKDAPSKDPPVEKPKPVVEITAVEAPLSQPAGSVKKLPPIPDTFVKIAGGQFMMGSPESEPERIDNEIPHLVTLSSFYMGKYVVTQREYEIVMEANPSHFKGTNLPVENISWYDAITYCNTRSIKEGFIPVYTIKGETVRCNWHTSGYRLPTEAEWEYACRAGTLTAFNTGDKITTDHANYDGSYVYNKNLKGIYREKTTSVGSFPPNAWGLYDMHGNVWEWCWDSYGNYTIIHNQTDPTGPVSGINRIIRGGSWGGGAQYLRSANRCHNNSFSRDSYLGFRVMIPCESNK